MTGAQGQRAAARRKPSNGGVVISKAKSTKSGDVRIASHVTGDGPRDLVFVC